MMKKKKGSQVAKLKNSEPMQKHSDEKEDMKLIKKMVKKKDLK